MHNINEFDRLYRRTVRQKSDGAATVRLELNRIKAKTLRVLTHVSVENTTSDYTKSRLGINASGNIHYIDELQTIEANELAVSRSDILLGEGDIFFAELTGTTASDELKMNCIGWEINL